MTSIVLTTCLLQIPQFLLFNFKRKGGDSVLVIPTLAPGLVQWHLPLSYGIVFKANRRTRKVRERRLSAVCRFKRDSCATFQLVHPVHR